jgi:hypothetical protein
VKLEAEVEALLGEIVEHRSIIDDAENLLVCLQSQSKAVKEAKARSSRLKR